MISSKTVADLIIRIITCLVFYVIIELHINHQHELPALQLVDAYPIDQHQLLAMQLVAA